MKTFEIVGFEHLHLHTDFSLLDGFGLVEEYAQRAPQINQKFLTVSDHGMLGAVPRQIKACERINEKKGKDTLSPIFACMPKGTPIHTLDGVKDISEVKKGDFVLTHKGRFRRVIRTMSRVHQGKVYSVKLSGVGRSKKVTCLTGEHPVLVFDRDGNSSWVKAENIDAKRLRAGNGIRNHSSYVAFPRMEENSDLVRIDLMDYQDRVYLNEDGILEVKKRGFRKTWDNIPRFVSIDEDFAYFLGLFTAEGSCSSRNERLTGGMRLSLHAKELNLAKRAADFLSRFDVNATCHYKETDNKMDVTFCCLPLVNFISKSVGLGSKNKKVPDFIFGSPLKVQKSFLEGLLDGDGKNPNRETNKSKQRTLKISSRNLAYQVRIILSNLGFWSNVYHRLEDGLNSYSVPISSSSVFYTRNLVNKDYILKPISSVSCDDKEIEVFNFEVEEDNSYVSDFAVHNCELYINRLQPESNCLEDVQKFVADLNEEEKIEIKASPHLLAIAYNDIGYKNLVRLTSWGWTKGFYRKPRVNYEQLLKHKEGLFFTSCCYNSEVGRAFDKGGEEAAYAVIERYVEMVGKDHYFLELMLLDFKKQKPYDAFIIKAHEKYDLPLILTNDCHYCNQEDSKFQRLMLMVQTNRTVQEIQKAIAADDTQDFFELQDASLWMKSEEELNQKWLDHYSDTIPYELFCEAKKNTVKLCERAKGVQLDRSLKLPNLPDADEVLKDEVMKGFVSRNLPKTKEYLERLKEEYSLITRKGFSSYFLIQKMMTDEARRVCASLLGWGDGSQACGPGRGCLEGSVLVLTEDGTSKPISEIKKGDSVWTNDGTAKPVLNTFEYPCDEDLLTLFTYYGDNRGVSLTKDHKVLVEKFQRVKNYNTWSNSTKKSKKTFVEPTGNLNWLPASEVEVGDWLFVPEINLKSKRSCKIDLSKYCNSTNLIFDKNFVYQCQTNPLTKLVKKKKCKRFIDTNDERFWIMVGLFAGDGWMRSDNRGNIGIAFHSKNDAFGLNLVIEFAILMGLDYSIAKHRTKKLKQFNINNRFIHRLFSDMFNNYEFKSQTKHVPKEVFSLPSKFKWAFLKGYFLSDGHLGENKISFDTTSITLASQVRSLLLSLGVPSSLNYMDRFDKRSCKTYFCYKINIPITEELVGAEAEKKYFYRKIKGGLLVKVRKIEELKGIKKVYDFEVQGNSNYLTSSFLVHNSAAGALTCYCLGITNVDPVAEGLLFSRFMSEARGGRSISLEFKNMDPLPANEVFDGN